MPVGRPGPAIYVCTRCSSNLTLTLADLSLPRCFSIPVTAPQTTSRLPLVCVRYRWCAVWSSVGHPGCKRLGDRKALWAGVWHQLHELPLAELHAANPLGWSRAVIGWMACAGVRRGAENQPEPGGSSR